MQLIMIYFENKQKYKTFYTKLVSGQSFKDFISCQYENANNYFDERYRNYCDLKKVNDLN